MHLFMMKYRNNWNTKILSIIVYNFVMLFLSIETHGKVC